MRSPEITADPVGHGSGRDGVREARGPGWTWPDGARLGLT